MIKQKGIIEYLEAARLIKNKYPNTEFHLVGVKENSSYGVSSNFLDKYIDVGIIKYFGLVDDIRFNIAQSDCVVLPSYYREGVPKSLLEASAMNKPIITTNNIGCKEVIKDKINGYVCNIKDSIDLADKMEKFINLSKEDKKRMGENARSEVKDRYDNKIVLNRYFDALEYIKKNKLCELRVKKSQ